MGKKTVLAAMLSIYMLLALTGYALAAGFNDIQGHWAETQINNWLEKGLAGGYEDGTFKPNNEVTRAEFVALVNRSFGIESQGAEADFTDVQPGQWYFQNIAAAKAEGYIGGYPDGTFRPNQTITRQEAASILVRLSGLEQTTEGLAQFKDAGQIPDWSRASSGAIAKAGFMGGYPDGTFKAQKSITRAEAIVTLDRALGYKPEPGPVTGAGAIEGTVTLEGEALDEATVRVFEAGSYKVLKETTIASDGKFKVELETGAYDITATTEKEVAYQSDVEVTGAQAATVDLTLEPAAVISGVLEDKNGKAVKNTTILFTTNPTFVAETDSKGEYTVPVLPDREYQVRAYDPGEEDAEPEVVKSSLKVGSAGEHDIGALQAPFSVSSGVGGGGGGGGGSAPVETVELNVTAGEPTPFPKSEGPVKVKITVTLDGKEIQLAVLLPRIEQGATVTITEIPDDLKPADLSIPFMDLDLTFDNLSVEEVTVELPMPDNLNSGEAGAFHYNSDLKEWEYREAKIEDGKLVFYTNLSPLCVTKKMPPPKNLTADVDNDAGSVTLQWKGSGGSDKVSYAVFRNDAKVASDIRSTTYTDEGLQAGEYTYYVKAYKEVVAGKSGKIIRFESVPSNKVTVTVEGSTPVNQAPVVSSPIADLTMTMGGTAQTIDLSEVFSDPDGDTLTYCASSDSDAVTATVTGSILTVTPVGVGSAIITVEASDGSLTATDQFEVTVTGGGGGTDLPRITKFAGIVVPEDENTIEVPLTSINTSTGIEVSKDAKLALNVEELGVIRQLSLVAGKENNIHNILIPEAEEIDVSDLDLDKLVDAASQCPPATKEEILKAVNFTGLFEILKGKPGIKDSITNETDLGELLEAVTTDHDIDKGDILDAVDIAAVINAVRNDGNITKDDIFNVVQFEELMKIVDENEDAAEILNAVDINALLKAQTKEDVINAVDFKALFEAINKTSESTKDAIVQTINFTALFDVVKKANSATTEAVFSAINFTDLFCAIADAGDETIAKSIDVTIQIIGIIQQHNITRSDILANVKFDKLNIESLFNWLSCIDGNPDVLTAEATLTDNAGNVNTYTINIYDSSGGGGDDSTVAPVATNFVMSGATFDGSGQDYSVDVQETTKVKELKFDLNVNSEFEITELINQAGTDILPQLKTIYPGVKTTGSLTAGAGREIDLIDLLAIPDPEGDGIAAGNLAQLVNSGNTTGSMTVKIKLANSIKSSANVTYNLTANIVEKNNNKKILFINDGSYTLWTGYTCSTNNIKGDFSNLANMLISKGYLVEERSVNPITPTEINNYDIIVFGLDLDYREISQEEADVLVAFVENGGSLFLLGDIVGLDELSARISNYSFNKIGKSFGIVYSESPFIGNVIWEAVITDIRTRTHELTKGVSSFYLNLAGSLSVTSPAIALAYTTEGDDYFGAAVLAVAEYGSGRVVSISDTNFLHNSFINNYNNYTLSDNIFNWLSSDSGKPVLQILSPTERAIINHGDTVNLSASATGVDYVKFYVENVETGWRDNPGGVISGDGNYSTNWSTTGIMPVPANIGRYLVQAVGYSKEGQELVDIAVMIKIKNPMIFTKGENQYL